MNRQLVQDALGAYAEWRKNGGAEPMFAVEAPTFYSDGFRKPVGGDAVVKSIRIALKCASSLEHPAYLDWLR